MCLSLLSLLSLHLLLVLCHHFQRHRHLWRTRLNPGASAHWSGMIGCLAAPTTNTGYEPNVSADVIEEHTPFNLPDSNRNFPRRDDATIFPTTEDPEGFQHSGASSSSKHTAACRVPKILGALGGSLWKQRPGSHQGNLFAVREEPILHLVFYQRDVTDCVNLLKEFKTARPNLQRRSFILWRKTSQNSWRNADRRIWWMNLLTLTTSESVSRYNRHKPNNEWNGLNHVRTPEHGECSDPWSELWSDVVLSFSTTSTSVHARHSCFWACTTWVSFSPFACVDEITLMRA